MAKINKVALLRPVLSEESGARAVARIKLTDGRTVSAVSACGLKKRDNGDYYYFLEGNVPPFFQMFALSGGEFSVLNEDEIGATAIAYVTEKDAFIDLYGTFSSNGMTVEEVREYAQTYFFDDEIESGKESFHGETEDEIAGRESIRYDDEMIADENYYEFSDVDKNNLRVKDDNSEKNEDAGIFGEARRERKEKSYDDSRDENEAGEGCFFFEKVGADVKDIFRKNPAEKDLERAVSDSKWAKVFCDGEKYYVVGLIYDGKNAGYGEKTPEYICYGVPGRYGEKPDSFTGFCSFIPSSPFYPKGGGYWVMYQDAENGKRL